MITSIYELLLYSYNPRACLHCLLLCPKLWTSIEGRELMLTEEEFLTWDVWAA